MQRFTLTLLTCSLLAGCFGGEKDADELCKAIPGMCGDLNIGDTHCKKDRDPLVRARYTAIISGRDLDKFEELKATKMFTRCMELSSVISATQLSDANARRMAALVHSAAQEDKLLMELSTSQAPEIIYYRWTQGDELAKDQFLALESSERLNTPYLKMALAGYYTHSDKAHAINILHQGLELVNSQMPLENQLILSLATLNLQIDNIEEAYVWTMVAAQFELTSGTDRLMRIKPIDMATHEMLQKKAMLIAEEIEMGRYRRQ
ncbi:DUF2989 domain-containing protein [Thaumasiovibrio subtropicus]|uniref:DUF2989 domain-containing protein n=1 Tax=Thaumasiovibrio subtropicus TaxID=1891207 RepID=UPI000B3567B3|nr:DUF2989 domain-containing protein [Thaumasiovibrio subtropicus]